MRGMEITAAHLRELIVTMSPPDLLGYLYAQRRMKAEKGPSATTEHKEADILSPFDENQFILEYVHAVLASDVAPEEMKFDKSQFAKLSKLGRKLLSQAVKFAIFSSTDTKSSVFGSGMDQIEFRAKMAWVTVRGNRYPVLEGEFYRYVLMPHDDILTELYGVGAADIAEGFQTISNGMRWGQVNAVKVLKEQFEAAKNFVVSQTEPPESTVGACDEENTDQAEIAELALDDMFRGGIANLSRHTKLPPTLLADLAYQRGEETEFFAAGAFAGTPYRTLPARKKPLIKIDSDYYAVDPYFIRDGGYRALLHNILKRKPDYKKIFEDRQKIMSEAAFADILTGQLPSAAVFQEVYYKDPATKQWFENDTLILLDDVLFLVEAKAGAAATIASPVLDFNRHVRSVQDLFLKAYKQCKRFFNYLNSAGEVLLYHKVNGKYEECCRVRRADYRVMVPIGLTVESFSPFSTSCKELPEVEPLLGRHAFISLSIDDLFVLKRLLPKPGEFAHYMEVRQAVAAIRGAHLIDEFDHLGAYLSMNRFDKNLADQLEDGKVHMVLWDSMSDIVDDSFEGKDWENRPFPTQDFPREVQRLLNALDATREHGWLAAESHIRDFEKKGRDNLAGVLSNLRQSLNQHPARYITFAPLSGGRGPLFVWLQKYAHRINWAKVNDKASAAALAFKASNVTGVVAEASSDGTYHWAKFFAVHIPKEKTVENSHIFEDAARMGKPERKVNLNKLEKVAHSANTKKPRRNDPCPCGSGLKYKRCHGNRVRN